MTLCGYFFLFPQAELEKRLCSDYPNTVFSELVIPEQNGKGLSVNDDDGKLKEDSTTKAAHERVQCCRETSKHGPSEKATKTTQSATKKNSLQGEQEEGPTTDLSLKVMADTLDTVMVSDEGQDACSNCEHCR